jgi:uncharacterized repeat protein (TIGR03837 family)
MQPIIKLTKWDIFCRVIDNYGDIGVCWRLARQLANEYGLQVRLWVDDLAPLHALCPEPYRNGVEVRAWLADFPQVTPADVVIEAFACELPPTYLAAMRQHPPVWINLEYLTAEAWAADFHCQPSVFPPLTKYFFFPGFTPQSGGLLREREPTTARPLHLPATVAGELRVSLFGYENAGVEALLDAWSQSPWPISCLVPESRLLPQVMAWMETRHGTGALTVHTLPFLTQDDYDGLLSSCDLNFVRGEDSFVRAQWAGKPLVWQIYPQAEDAHLPKLQAFLQIYSADLPKNVADDLTRFFLGWNLGKLSARIWEDFWRHRSQLQTHAARWRAQLIAQPDLVCNLVNFCKVVFEKQQNRL